MVAIEAKLLPVQFDFLTDDSPWSLIYGGRGSSKSTALGWGVVPRAAVPGTREGLYRQRLIDLKGTTLKTMLEGDGNLPPILPYDSYHHNKELKTIKIKNGGEIVYNGLDQGDVGRTMGSTGKGSSMNLSGAHFDEAVEMQLPTVLQVCMSVRLKIPGVPLVRRFACNPGPPSSWIAQRWGLAPGTEAMPGHVWRHARPTDNWHLPPEYIEQLEQLEGVARERYLLGRWVGSDGLVYDRFDRHVHVQERPREEMKTFTLGIDDGYTDPFVVLEIGIDTDNRFHIAREVYESKLVMDEKIARVKAHGEHDCECVFDSAAPDLIETSRRKGIRAFAADKGQGSVEYGINIIRNLLKLREDGTPGLTVDPSCVNTIREFESYELTEGPDGLKDKPRDRDNHAMDAGRYAIRRAVEERGLRVLGPDPDEVKKQEEPKSFAEMRAADPEWGW